MEPHNLEDEMTISDLIEAVFVSRYVGLGDNIEMPRQKLQGELQMEKLARLHAEKEFKKREEPCPKDQECYEALLKKLFDERLLRASK